MGIRRSQGVGVGKIYTFSLFGLVSIIAPLPGLCRGNDVISYENIALPIADSPYVHENIFNLDLSTTVIPPSVYLSQSTTLKDFPRTTIDSIDESIRQDEELRELEEKLPQDGKPIKQPKVPVETPIPPQPQKQQQLNNDQKRILLDAIIENSLVNSAKKYPWLVNTSDQLIIKPNLYNPREVDTTLNIDLRFNSAVKLGAGDNTTLIENPELDNLNYSHYMDDEDFYWVLDQNRIVIEIEGVHGDVRFQGRSTNSRITQEGISSQSLFGVQAVWSIQSAIAALMGNENEDGVSVTSTAVEVTSPAGTVLGGVTIDTGLDLNNPNIVVLDDVSAGDTFSELGGGSLFENLDADNTPGFLQGFPTINLQALINGDTQLREGEIIPVENLTAAGIRFGDNFTGEGFEFTAPISSTPGLRLLRPNVGTNEDLVVILSNPFITQEEKDFHYLNSLMWFNLGQRLPNTGDLTTLEQIAGNDGWYRYTSSHSWNRTLIQYNSEKIEASYANIFSNPGFSLTFTPVFDQIDHYQTANATLGMALGGLFRPLNANSINAGLKEAKDNYENLQPFSRLQTKATKQERRKINNRLNAALRHAESTSALEQVSGSWTFSGKSKPKHSRLFQLKTGLYKRGVFFQSRDFRVGPEGPVFISNLRASNEDFGPLIFRGEQVPIDSTGITPLNRVIVAQTIVNLPTGETVVLNSDSRRRIAFTTVPFIDVRAFDIAFDLIELSRAQSFTSSSSSYIGNLFLPAVEWLMAGSSGNFKYGVSIGGWFNLKPDAAPQVTDNQPNLSVSTTEEPGLGGFAIASLNWLFRDLKFDKEKRLKGYMVHAPFFKFDWNSATNRLNTAYLLGGYQFQWTDRHLGFSITPALSYAPNGLNAIIESLDQGELSGSLFSRFNTRKGLNLTFDGSIGNDFFYATELTHKIIESNSVGKISLGGYLSNYNTLNRGITSRVPDMRYGGIIQYQYPKERFYLDIRLGAAENGFEIQFQSGFKLNL